LDTNLIKKPVRYDFITIYNDYNDAVKKFFCQFYFLERLTPAAGFKVTASIPGADN